MIYIRDPEKAFDLLYKIIAIDLKLSQRKYWDEIKKLDLGDPEKFLEYSEHIKRKLTKN